jgi:hypothetical protein|eukprot:COSAG01_NODE_3034_length_6690_cov_55.198149_3_plen_56_part_00
MALLDLVLYYMWPYSIIIGVYRLSQSKHTILATSDASLAAPALGIYVASIHRTVW